MNSGQARRSRVGRGRSARIYGALVALCISTAALAHAQPSHHLVLVQPENSELITRVEGQTRDLDVSLDVATSGWSTGNAEDAARIATQRGADFVARVRRSAQGGLEVRVYAVRSRSLRARNVPAHSRSDRLTTSAELEAAALVLRGELSALIEAEREAAASTPPSTAPTTAAPPTAAGGSPAGTSSSRGRSQQLPSATTKPAPVRAKPAEPAAAIQEEDEDRDDEDEVDDEAEEEAEPEEPPSPPLESYTNKRSPWTLRGGLRGSSPLGSKFPVGLLVGGRAQLLPFLEVGLAVGTALPFQLTDPTVRIALWRSFASAEALAVFPVGPRLRALVGLDAGVVLYARRTRHVLEGFAADGGEQAWSATLGAQAELQWLLTRQFGVALGVGLSYLPQRTRFAYTDEPSSKPHEIAALRSVEPQATASFFGQFGD